MTIDFLAFATGGGANVESQAAYLADATTGTGFVSGTATSAKLNKVWRQSSFMAAVVATFVGNQLSANVLDDGNLSAHVTQLANAILSLTAIYAPLASPALTGTPTSPTPSGGDNSTKVATTAFVATAIAGLAPLASPTFTGTPLAPTPAVGDSSTKIATTAFATRIGAPTGAIFAFAANAAPSGWLECNGAAVSRTTYATLFVTIGTVFGVGDGSTTFNLPDMRGQFVRGWDDSAGVDPGRVFGSQQSDLLAAHSHNIKHYFHSDNSGSFLAGAAGPNSTSASTDATGGAETRPKNVALLFIIKT